MKKTVFFTLVILCSLGLTYSIINVFYWYNDSKEIKNETAEIIEDTKIIETKDNSNTEIIYPSGYEQNDYWSFIQTPLISVDFDELLKTNSDTVGWIEVPNTIINYPIVQAKDNKYYLSHSFNKKANKGGWIYLDYRNNFETFDKNNIIYGHGRWDNTLFGTLKNIVNYNWYSNKDNHIIRISTPTTNSMWHVFSVYTIKPESYYLTTDFKNNEFKTFTDTILARSLYNFNTSVNNDDKIITLSTCYNDQLRVVLHARLIKKESR